MSSQGIEQEKAGVLDLALGLSSRQGRCTTCGLDYVKCQGHFGHILLSVPLFHPGYYKHIAAILQRICWSCGKVLCPGNAQLNKQQQLVICPHCHENVHPVFASSEDRMLLTPQYILDVFSKIRDEELQILLPILKNTRPENLILTVLPVPPACIRPSIIEQTGINADVASRTHEDDITSALVQILVHNNNISTSLNQGNDGLYKSWFAMQEQLNSMVGLTQPKTSFYNLLNITSPGQMLSDETDQDYDDAAPDRRTKTETTSQAQASHRFPKAHEANRPAKTILNKLSGKYGRFRGNLSGKRVDFSGRSVISPDPDLRVDEIGIPYAVSRILTYPEVVNETNLEWINELIRNDQVDHVEKHGAFTPVQYLKPKGGVYNQQSNQSEHENHDIAYSFDCKTIGSVPWYEYEFSTFGVDYKANGALIQQRKQEDITQFNRNIQVKHKNQNARQNYLQTFTHSQRIEHNNDYSFTAGTSLDQIEKNKKSYNSTQKQSTQYHIDFQKINEEGFSSQAQEAAYRFISVPTTTLLNAQRQVDIQPGDIVHRFLQDGDPLLFNRQPSLHKSSIACFRARIHQKKSFSFNVANCPNFGSDYDGDEMNIHYLQGVEARAEVDTLISHADNLVDNATGALSMQIMQDAISGIYILTHETFMSFQEYTNYVLVDWQSLNSNYGYLGWPDKLESNKDKKKQNMKNNVNQNDFLSRFYGSSPNHVTSQHIEQPAILYPKQLYTGKQLVSQVLWNHTRENSITFSSPKDDLCLIDSRVVKGHLSKKLIGLIFTQLLENKILNLGKRRSLENQVLDLIYSLQRVALRYMRNSGFSIGINDVWESDAMVFEKKRRVIHSLYQLGFRRFSEVQYLWRYPQMKDCIYGDYDSIAEYCKQASGMELPAELLKDESDDVKRLPDAKIQSLLSDLREQLSEELLRNISNYDNAYNNSVLVMSKSGSKGSTINQVQMTSLLSQQSVSNGMIRPTYGGRTVPHFVVEKLHNPFQFGFVGNSFFNGLQPYEFLFHTASGREGVIDTAIKTSSTGYIQRKLLKSLESAFVDWNNNVVCNRLIHFSKLFASEEPNQADDILVNELYNQKLEDFAEKQLQVIMASTETTQEKEKAKDANQTIQPNHVLKEAEKLIKQTYYNYSASQHEKEVVLRVLERYIEKNCSNNSLPTSLQPIFKIYKLKQFIKCIRYYINVPKRWIEPYTPVGALAGQALGEPTTQMTLKTFHFAGLASKIQGVPRLIQIFNASKTARGGMFIYPRIQYKEKIKESLQSRKQQTKLKDLNIYGTVLEDDKVYHDSETQAQYLKRQIEPTYLEEISTIKLIYNPSLIAIQVELDVEKIKNMLLQVTIKQIKEQISKQIKLVKICSENITEIGSSTIQISGFDSMDIPAGRSRANQDKQVSLQQCKAINILEALKRVLVSGMAECQVVVDSYSYAVESQSERFQLYLQNQHAFDRQNRVEDLTPLEDTQYYLYTQTPQKPLQLLTNPAVDPYLSYTQNIHAIANIFGIEAARYSIVNEIHQLYKDYGMNICRYHVDLLGSFMTVTGNIYGFTNMGLKQLKKDRTIVLASFERTGEYLFEAGIKSVEETFNDVSEDLIFGNCIKVGSGLVKLEWEDDDFVAQTGRPW